MDKEKDDKIIPRALQVEIYNEVYKIKSDGDEKYIRNLAELIDGKMREISSDTLTVDSLKVALLTSLHLADENFQLKSSLEVNSSQTVKATFDFPKELKASCEQYLLYFAEFLRDLGINASSNLREEAGKVLFSVTPNDDLEALDKIREALGTYLNLPASPIVYNESFAAMRLQQQIENLHHSQRMAEREIRTAEAELRLAQTVIESQDKIILQKDSIIEQQNKVIEKITSKSIMMDSLENKEELEKFCEGFEVGKSEFLIKYFGLHLNPATVLKTAGKKILGKGESESILDLGEETDKDN